MLGVQAFPSLLFLLLIKFIPESPRWLILKKQNKDAAKQILQIINPQDYEKELENIIQNNAAESRDPHGEILFSKRYKFPAFLAVLFAILN